MSRRKATVETYFEGFRQGDHARILACLTDDVAWDLPGHAHLRGKSAFDAEIERDEFEGRPKLTINRLIEEADTVVAIGTGASLQAGGDAFRFAYCDVFTFRGEAICRVESYLVPLVADPDKRA